MQAMRKVRRDLYRFEVKREMWKRGGDSASFALSFFRRGGREEG